MAENSKIEWCDATWQVTHGCQKVSEGCANCYAIRDAHRMAGHPNPKINEPRKDLVTPDGKHWTGVVRTAPENIAKPLHWKKPKRIFVNSNSDLFHEDVPFEFIAAVYGVMAACPQHTFMVLTKRPERMKAFFDWDAGEGRASEGAHAPGPGGGILLVVETIKYQSKFLGSMCDELLDVGERLNGSYDRGFGGLPPVWDDCELPAWPPPNVWLGTSVENQEQADKRIPHLLSVPAALRFLSMEPLIGEVDACEWLGTIHNDQVGSIRDEGYGPWVSGIDWVIVGGESGPNARPMHPVWVRSIRDDCAEADVPFFFKQWGECVPYEVSAQPPFLIGQNGDCFDSHLLPDDLCDHDGEFHKGWMADVSAALMEPPADVIWHRRIGKRAAGRLLDGVEHNGMPGDNQ